MYYGGGTITQTAAVCLVDISFLPRDTNSRGNRGCPIRADRQKRETRSVHSLHLGTDNTIKLVAPDDPWGVFLESVCEKYSRLARCHV